jgi:hypothetical protein
MPVIAHCALLLGETITTVIPISRVLESETEARLSHRSVRDFPFHHIRTSDIRSLADPISRV